MAEDWMGQAHLDLRAARDSVASGHYEWAPFRSHQAAEKAAKALQRHHHLEASGHAIVLPLPLESP